MPDTQTVEGYAEWARTWLMAHVLTWQAAGQLGAVVLALLIAAALARPVRGALQRAFESMDPEGRRARLARVSQQLALPALWLVMLGASTSVAAGFEQPHEIPRIVATLLAAWIVIRISSLLISEPFWAHTVASIAWLIAALEVLHLLDPTLAFLDSVAIELGGGRVSVLSVLKGVALASALLWAALSVSSMLQRRIARLPNLTPSIQTLLAQTLRIALIAIAVMVALGAVGIDITTFAIFGGAVGVGIGFGLQKIVSNLISGIILLLDHSIKPGDLIAVGDNYGRVESLGARYASVVTRDGTEWLIPNEDLITQQVANLSYSSTLVRRKVPIGIAYGADVDKATEIMLQAAADAPRIVATPEPRCNFVAFGASSLDFELNFWLADPEEGVASVIDGVLRQVWREFKANDIEVPFPQRDLHIRSSEVPLGGVQGS